MKKVITLALSLVLAFTLVGCGSDSKDKGEFKVGILQLMDHPSLNTIQDAITKELDANDIAYDVQNAQNDTTVLDSMCKKFVDDKVDVIIAITTPGALAAAKYAKDVPVVFAAVSDVKEAKLTNDLEAPDLNITGTSDEIQVESIMGLATEMYPDTKTIGYIYNSGEVNSVANLKKLEAYASDKGFTIEKAAVTGAADIQSALSTLLGKSDIIFSPTDNTVASAMAQVSAMCNDAKIPFFTGADSMVKDGGLATYGINYNNLGLESAKMAIQICKGTKVKEIPVKIFKEDLKVYLNTDTAKAIGFDGIDALQDKYDVELVTTNK